MARVIENHGECDGEGGDEAQDDGGDDENRFHLFLASQEPPRRNHSVVF